MLKAARAVAGGAVAAVAMIRKRQTAAGGQVTMHPVLSAPASSASPRIVQPVEGPQSGFVDQQPRVTTRAAEDMAALERQPSFDYFWNSPHAGQETLNTGDQHWDVNPLMVGSDNASTV